MMVFRLRSSFILFVLVCLAFLADTFLPFDSSGHVVMAAAWVAPVVAGAVSALGSLGSTIAGWKSQADANATNERIARENRDWQSSENQLNRDWQEKMWNAQNQYNTPSAMKARMQEAGWNPFLANSVVGSASNAQSAGSPSMSSAPNQPTIRPYDFSGLSRAGDQISDAVSNYAQMKGVDAESANQRSQANKNIVETGKEIYRTFGKNAAAKYVNGNLRSVNGQYDNSLYARQEVARTAFDEANASRAELDYEIENSVGRQRASQTVLNMRKASDVMDAQISRLAKQNEVSDADIKKSAADVARAYAEAFNARKQGDYYVVSAQQMSIINRSMSLDLQDRQAQFEFDSSKRAFQLNPENSNRSAELFGSQLEGSQVSADMEGNKAFRYGERVAHAAGDLFKVGLNVSK